jgi:hypothetical protein
MKHFIMSVAVLVTGCSSIPHSESALQDKNFCRVRKEFVHRTDMVKFTPLKKPYLIRRDANQWECAVTLRAQMGEQWQTVEGRGLGLDQAAACLAAQENSRLQVLDLSPATLQGNTELVCDSGSDAQLLPLQLNSTVNINDERLKPYPGQVKRYYFDKQRMPAVICEAKLYNVTQEQQLKQYAMDVCQVGADWKILTMTETKSIDLK